MLKQICRRLSVIGFSKYLLNIKTLLTTVETVDKSISARKILETTTVKDVYTPVDNTVDNFVSCGIKFEIAQMNASNSLNIRETNSYPQVFQHG
jgi:hypothetical protein